MMHLERLQGLLIWAWNLFCSLLHLNLYWLSVWLGKFVQADRISVGTFDGDASSPSGFPVSGTVWYSDGKVYQGNFTNGVWDGKGLIFPADSSYFVSGNAFPTVPILLLPTKFKVAPAVFSVMPYPS